MGTFYGPSVSPDEIWHWGMKRGFKAKDHKYYQRIPWKRGYRYFYTKDEYQAYLTGKDHKQNPATGLLKTAGSLVSGVTKTVKDVTEKAQKAIEDQNRTRGRYDELKEGNHPKKLDDLPKQNKSLSEDQDQKCVNPNYSTKNETAKQVIAEGMKLLDDSLVTKEVAKELTDRYGYRNNCAYCTLAYDMRRKGYDVEASSINTKTANTPKEIESWYKGGKFKVTGTEYAGLSSEQASQKITQELSSQGQGARGQFCMYWKQGGGHSISYEVDRAGNVVYRDCQTGATFHNDGINEYLKNVHLTEICHMRTDNLEFSDKALRGVRPRKRRKK